MTTRFIVVRHCEAEGNIRRVFNGITNGDITQNGERQLSFLSCRMKCVPFDYLYSSPLIRAVKTARACNAEHNLPIHILQDLIEINGGNMENVRFSDFPVRFPRESRLWNLEPHNFCIANGETMKAVYLRISSAVLMLSERHAGKTVCIASHGCVIRNLICWAKGWNIDRINEVDWGENTSVTVVDIDQAGRPSLIAENDSSHLPGDCVTLGKQTWWKKEQRDSLYFE